MRNVYKTVAILFFGMTLISAQGVDRQPQKNNQSDKGDRGDRHENRYVKSREVVRYDPGFRSGGHHGDYGRKNGRNHQKYDRVGHGNSGHGVKYKSYGHFDHRYAYRPSYGQIAMHHGRMFKIHEGLFYVTRHGRWVAAPGPVGLRVMRLPLGARSFRTKYGPLYEFRGTFYLEAKHGIGYVVTEPPRKDKRGYRDGR